ncbi:MAG: hypothetical protein J5I92_00225 [Thiogranum sp.]|nr:hypothetical protein [Thiogranum sp.]
MSHNSSQRFDRPLQVELRASRLLFGVALLLYLAALLSCAWAPLPGAWRAGLCGLLCLHFVFVCRHHLISSAPRAVRGLAWDLQRGWRIRGPREDWQQVALCTPVFVSYRLAVARFRCGRWRTRSVMLVADRAGDEDFRRLRVRLIQSTHGDRDRTQVPRKG